MAQEKGSKALACSAKYKCCLLIPYHTRSKRSLLMQNPSAAPASACDDVPPQEGEGVAQEWESAAKPYCPLSKHLLRVLACPPEERLLESCPEKQVLACSPEEWVLACPPEEWVLAYSPEERVLACPPEMQVLACPPGKQVLA